MPNYKVQSVDQIGAGEGQGGPWTRQKLTVQFGDGDPQTVVLFCNKYQPIPEVGATIDGEIQPPKQEGWVPELKPARRNSGGGSKEYKADPAKQRAIAMEAAQKVAVDVLRLAMEQGVWKAPDEKPVGEMAGIVKTIAQSLFTQIEEVAK